MANARGRRATAEARARRSEATRVHAVIDCRDTPEGRVSERGRDGRANRSGTCMP